MALSLKQGKNKEATDVDIAALNFSDNLYLPQVPKKAQKGIVAHMADIGKEMSQKMKIVDMVRSNEVVEITVSCADLFAPNATELKEQGEKRLEPLAIFLKSPSYYKMLIAVHSDNTGETKYLDDLTESRAEAIFDYLCEASGTDGSNVVPYGLGAESPLFDNNSIECRAENRRVEFYIVPREKLIEQAKAGQLK